MLTTSFWATNKYKEFIPSNSFSRSLLRVLSSQDISVRVICSKFLTLLAKDFALNVEGITDPLHFSSVFEQWCSETPNARDFGALGNFFETDLVGRNTFVFSESPKVAEKVESSSSKVSTPQESS